MSDKTEDAAATDEKVGKAAPSLSEIQMVDGRTAEDIIQLIETDASVRDFIEEHQAIKGSPTPFDETIENMRNFNGWAIGNLTLIEAATKEVLWETTNVWVELLNGEGKAACDHRKVRFFNFRQDRIVYYTRGTAYCSKEEMEHLTWENELHRPVWYVDEFIRPNDPQTGSYEGDDEIEGWMPEFGTYIDTRTIMDKSSTEREMSLARGEKALELAMEM